MFNNKVTCIGNIFMSVYTFKLIFKINLIRVSYFLFSPCLWKANTDRHLKFPVLKIAVRMTIIIKIKDDNDVNNKR